MSLYELAILGTPTAAQVERLSHSLAEMIADFNLSIGSDVVLHTGATVGSRNIRAPFAAAYFAGDSDAEADLASTLSASSLPVIPVIPSGGSFAAGIPACIQGTNGLRLRGDDQGLTELAVVMLECVGLLRKQRRVFVSYRRTEARSAAMQLHDLLTSRGFDVFLDTHDIRPGEPFQDALWNRLCDSDVMIMLDTPTYFESKWTRQEIGRARAKEIQVLRVIWPDHKPNKLTDMSETIYLEAPELEGPDGPIIGQTADSIVLAVESLRSRSIASRYMSITGKLRSDVEMIGGSVEGIGAHRAISIRLLDERVVWAYPIVGVPTAELFHDVADKANRANQSAIPIVVYDHVGIRQMWATHLKWLDDNISSVKAIKVSEAGWRLAAWEA